MKPNVNDMILFHDLFTGTYEIRIDPASAQQMIADYRESIERESAAEIATLKAQRDELQKKLGKAVDIYSSHRGNCQELRRHLYHEWYEDAKSLCAAIANAEKDKPGC